MTKSKMLFRTLVMLTMTTAACGMKNPEPVVPSGPVDVESVEIEQAEVNIDVTSSKQLTITVLPANASDKTVVWTSSNHSVAKVDNTGKVTALVAGEAIITATTYNGKHQDACVVKVVDPDEGKEYKLVWAEEFGAEGDGAAMPDSGSWGIEVQPAGWVNDELQRYVNSPNNIEVSNGTLKLTCRQEEDKTITSGRIHSGNKKTFTYGRFEIRAKLPGGKGIWPAIWMHGQNIGSVGWPTCGEIDIMEYVGYDPGRIHASIHTRDRNHSIGTQVTAQTMVPTCSDEFHVYTLEWTRTSITMLVDGKKYFNYTPKTYDLGDWPFNAAEMVILNVAWGGWGAAGGGVDVSVLPQTMEVDYVRVYQKQ